MWTSLKLEEGWSTFFLLWGALTISAITLHQADLITGMQMIPVVGTIGLIMGTLLAKSRFSANVAHSFALFYGIFVVFYFVGSTSFFDGISWHDRIVHPENSMIARQIIWFSKLFDGGTSRDGLIFVFQTAVLFWLLGYTAAWYTFRNLHIWHVVLPMGVVILSVVYYYGGSKPLHYYLGAYALLTALYIARTHLFEQERNWQIHTVRYKKGVSFSFIRAALLTAVLALLFAWWIPPLSVNATFGSSSGPWRDFQDHWSRMFSALRTYGTNTADPYQDTLVLGGPRTVGNIPVMDVTVSKELPYTYWQAIVYDTYEGEGWHRSFDTHSEHFPDEGYLNIPRTRSRELVNQTIHSYFPNSSFIYAAPEIVGADQPLIVSSQADENGNMLISTVRSKFVLQQGDVYEVTSRISTADAPSLRSASTNYDQWIIDTYLQLPNTITPETLALAQEITAPYDNPYDKAVAVQNHLRERITYNDQIAAPPDGVDPVHYTLFISQEGYCNYYASAMAIMLRAQGIPARVVSGYAQGSYDDTANMYRVRASNAHTWVEAYFPDYGWIQFEPTASVPVIVRADAAEESPAEDDTAVADDLDPLNNADLPLLDDELPDSLPPDDNTDLIDRGAPNLPTDSTAVAAPQLPLTQRYPIWQALGAIAAFAVAVALSLFANKLNEQVEKDIDRSYGRLDSWSRWVGLTSRPDYTPYERAEALATAVPEGREPILSLTHQYVRKLFSRHKTHEEGYDSLPHWQQLRPLLLRQSIRSSWQRFKTRLAKFKRPAKLNR